MFALTCLVAKRSPASQGMWAPLALVLPRSLQRPVEGPALCFATPLLQIPQRRSLKPFERLQLPYFRQDVIPSFTLLMQLHPYGPQLMRVQFLDAGPTPQFVTCHRIAAFELQKGGKAVPHMQSHG